MSRLDRPFGRTTPSLQATWVRSGALRFGSRSGPLAATVSAELPALAKHVVDDEVGLGSALAILAEIPSEAGLSDSVKCFAACARLALELASRQCVVPAIEGNRARWRALLATPSDRARAEAIAAALPRVAVPAELSPDEVVRGFLDAAVDTLYRSGTWPGPAKGVALDLSEALRTGDGAVRIRDLRFRGLGEQLAALADEAESTDVRLGIALGAPAGPAGMFTVRFTLLRAHAPPLDLERGWSKAGALWAVIRGLARAVRLHPPLGAALRGPTPRAVALDADGAWAFVRDGLPALRAAGFDVDVPPGFERGGKNRLHARLRVGVPGPDADASTPCPCRWEVTLGDEILPAHEVAQLRSMNHAILRFRDQWIVVDPADLAALPKGPEALVLPGAEAVTAVLCGVWKGVPVVADDALGKLIEMLRDPPELKAPPGLIATLRPYQARGVGWLAAMGRLGLGSCLADDMGLGKTIQLLAHLLNRRARTANRRPSLVVCPTSVLGNWIREIERFAPSLKVVRYHGATRGDRDAIERADVVLTTYGILVRDERLADYKWDVVALDEAQSIKNADSQRAQVARRLQARHRVALSGTPIENRLDELWSLFEFLMPGMLGPRAKFRREIAIPIERFGDADAAAQLRTSVGPFLLRRLKSDPDIAPDLPDKFEQVQLCALMPEQAKLYAQVVEEQMELVALAAANERRGRILGMLTRLKQVCNHPVNLLKDDTALGGRSGKLARATELLQQISERGERTLVFTQYVEMGFLLVRWLKSELGWEAPFLHGGTPAQHRDAIVERFQRGEGPPVLIISLRAGGTGLNLTSATHVIHYDRWWNPAVEDQATDRAHRIGQLRDVMVHKLVCIDTLEERIDKLLEEKRALADSIVGTGESLVASMDDDTLRRLVALGSEAVLE